jgi:hypothetical protein
LKVSLTKAPRAAMSTAKAMVRFMDNPVPRLSRAPRFAWNLQL